jgi:glutamine amidotransferase PdxT
VLAACFHPELDEDHFVTKHFVSLVEGHCA